MHLQAVILARGGTAKKDFGLKKKKKVICHFTFGTILGVHINRSQAFAGDCISAMHFGK